MNEITYRKRIQEFEAIQEYVDNNVAIHQIVKLYASGTIATREEALFQMVICLAKNWHEMNFRNFELAQKLGLTKDFNG